MPGKKDWDEEDSDESGSEESSPKVSAVRRGKFDDEEGDDDDVLDSWDAGEDSEVEREKAKKAEAAKKAAEEEAKANHKSKTTRMKEHIEERRRLKDGDEDEDDDEDEDETPAQARERQRQLQKESDLKTAQDLFGGDVGSIPSSRRAPLPGSAIPIDPKDPTKTIDISSLALFNPSTKLQFENLRNILGPIIANNAQKAQYTMFMVEFAKQLTKDLPSEQIRKISSGLATLGNEKMKEEKAADKTTKKTKAAKSKTTLAMARPSAATDTKAYDDAAFGDDDFM